MRSLIVVALGMGVAGLMVGASRPAEAFIRKEPEFLSPAPLVPVDAFVVVERKKAEKLLWAPPERAEPYMFAIRQAEKKYNLPTNMLARVLYQESRFRQDIITGELKSSAGAVGIAQIVPKWHPTVNPLDPYQSIDYAGDYLRKLHNQFNDWQLALAAYNWGPGNVANKGIAKAPKETRDYYTQILADVEV